MFENLRMIPVEERLPEIDQDVIVWNGTKLAAAKYIKTRRLSGNNLAESEVVDAFEFQVEKYPCEMDRSIVTYWSTVTHWMPATL